MPEMTITIGGRPFQVACQPGEESFLRSAAAILDAEAQPLVESLGRVPEARMLLMAGLMLADKAAAMDDEISQLRARISELETQPAPAPERIEVPVEVPVEILVEVPVIPPQVEFTLSAFAGEAELIASRLEALNR